MFFAPLGVTGVVILGALVFVWTSEPEPVDRPEVERVDLSQRDPVPEVPRLSSVPTTRQFERAAEEEANPSLERRLSAREGERESTSSAPPSDLAQAAESEDDYEDEDEDDEYEDDEPDAVEGVPDPRTPEEIAAAKAHAREVYLGGRGPFSKALNMTLAMTQSEPVEEATEAVDAEKAASDRQELAVPAQDLRALGGARGQN